MFENIITKAEFESDLAESLRQYEKYRRIVFSQDVSDWNLAAFGWRPLDELGSLRSPNFSVIRFNLMSDDFAWEIARYINQFVLSTKSLKAWADLLDDVDDEGEKSDILHEFVNPLIHFGLGLPYAIKQKFTFLFSHLSHQMRLLVSPSNPDCLVGDGKINYNTANGFAGDCAAGDLVLDAINEVASDDFSSSTRDLRHGFSHRITPGIEVGITSSVKRMIITGGQNDPLEARMKSVGLEPIRPREKHVVYGYGASEPMTLHHVVSVLKEQIRVIHSCFECYKTFVIDRETWIIGEYGLMA
ncbi:MAG: hypothetical protein LBE86_02495 [Gemmobacter sp.]|jgi:hypothetical protein|nr:hypothetical protein [Gemmobacter sp.]